MRAFRIHELRERPSPFLFRGRYAEPHALRAHLLMEPCKIVNGKAQLDAARGLALRRRMQREARLAGGELAPAWRLKLERQTDDIPIERASRFRSRRQTPAGNPSRFARYAACH